ncbi:hypothetical protein [Luteimicrobium subarcticum]|uniref:hypothetical protein n=1 Tax=Luteimicrobium subarcticum TaxID=620910 RepID=UPI000C23BE09|nr:hypothetical protein [Luteimicrobium subarcticum]
MARVTAVTAADVRQRAATAREHFQVTLERLEIALGRPGPSPEAQVAASNAVSAAIAACDALCGDALGQHASGQDHRAAVAMLSSIRPDGQSLGRRLSRLLNDKTLFQYGTFCTG